MKKLYTLFLFLVMIALAQGQTKIGRQLVEQYPTNPSGGSTYALTWLPSDYSITATTRYPLIIFLHSAGETGSGVSGLNKLITQSLPKVIAQGWDPQAVNPVDNQTYQFIVVSPQSSSWSYSYEHVSSILPAVMKRYRIDSSRIYITGPSAGGSGTWSCVTNDSNFTKKISAVVPIAAGEVNNYSKEDKNVPYISGKYGVKVWTICGTEDPRYTGTINFVNRINNATPAPTVPAKLTGLKGFDHVYAVFDTAYKPTWRNNALKLSIYEWMLQYQRGVVMMPPPPPPPNQDPIARAGADVTITLPTNSVQVNGNTSSDNDGTIKSYNWSKIAGPTTFTISNSTIANPQITNLVEGSYTFRLTVTDNQDASASDDIIVKVNPEPVVTPPPTDTTTPPPPTTGATKYIKVNIYGDGGRAYSNSEWNNWDFAQKSATSVSSSTFKYSDGTISTVKAVISYSDYIRDNGTGYGNSTSMAPAEVLRYCSYAGVNRTLTISGLAAGRKYNIELYASRNNNPGNSTIFIVNGNAQTIVTYNNLTQKASYSNIPPNAQGQIVVGVNKATDYSYLNGFIITEITPATTMASAGATNQTASATDLNAAGSSFNVYPNPVSDNLTVDFNNSYRGMITVQVIDLKGMVMKEFKVAKDQEQFTQIFSLSKNLQAGNYLIKIQAGDWKETRRIVKL